MKPAASCAGDASAPPVREGEPAVIPRVLDGRVVRVEWGARNVQGRQRKQWYDSDGDARNAYFGQVESLLAGGFIDADSVA